MAPHTRAQTPANYGAADAFDGAQDDGVDKIRKDPGHHLWVVPGPS